MPQFYAQPNPIFQPAMRLIASITQANPAVVTTTFDHLYITGTIVRLDIPPQYGMQQLDGFVGPITATGSTTFSFPIDSTLFQAFAVPSPISPQQSTCAMVVPIGEDNSILTAAVQNTLPHSS
jgi:hypothetical protein